MKCSECRFWVADRFATDKPPFDGRQCRRHAPQPVNYELLMLAACQSAALDGRERVPEDGHRWPDSLVQWPLTCEDDFCGDFVAKVEKRVGFV